MNLEDFFIEEHKKLRREYELLKEENANLNRRIEKIPKPVKPQACSMCESSEPISRP